MRTVRALEGVGLTLTTLRGAQMMCGEGWRVEAEQGWGMGKCVYRGRGSLVSEELQR